MPAPRAASLASAGKPRMIASGLPKRPDSNQPASGIPGIGSACPRREAPRDKQRGRLEADIGSGHAADRQHVAACVEPSAAGPADRARRSAGPRTAAFLRGPPAGESLRHGRRGGNSLHRQRRGRNRAFVPHDGAGARLCARRTIRRAASPTLRRHTGSGYPGHAARGDPVRTVRTRRGGRADRYDRPGAARCRPTCAPARCAPACVRRPHAARVGRTGEALRKIRSSVDSIHVARGWPAVAAQQSAAYPLLQANGVHR